MLKNILSWKIWTWSGKKSLWLTIIKTYQDSRMLKGAAVLNTSVWENNNETQILMDVDLQKWWIRILFQFYLKTLAQNWYLSSLFLVSERLSQHFDFAAAKEKRSCNKLKVNVKIRNNFFVRITKVANSQLFLLDDYNILCKYSLSV